MQFTLAPDQEAWRQEVRAFFARVMTPRRQAEIRRDGRDWDPDLYQAIADGGYAALSMLKEYGGMERGYMEVAIFTEEAVLAGVPPGVISVFGATVHFAAHAIVRLGNPAQRQRWLPSILDGSIRSSQGFTEPGCGSDLAAVATSAVADGDDFVVNGQKIFNSAEKGTHLFTLVRSDLNKPKHRGISILFIDLRSPGVTIQPMVSIGGWTRSTVHFDNVRVPRDSLLGEQDNGWYSLMHIIDLERSAMHMPVSRMKGLRGLVEQLDTTDPDQLAEPMTRSKLALIYQDLLVGWLLSYKVLWLQETHQNATGFASYQKVWNAEAGERLAHLAMDILGPESLIRGQGNGAEFAPMNGWLADWYLNCRVQQMGGGTMEIQRNIIAQRILGLPRE